jgi:hypothetical protein
LLLLVASVVTTVYRSLSSSIYVTAQRID